MTLDIFNLSDAVETVVTVITYPFVAFINFVIGLVYLIWAAFHGLFNAFMGLYHTLSSFFVSFMSGMFPSSISGIMLVCVLIVVMLRIYFFVKDISILGNKV